jgi:hypothetical protein
MNLSRYSNVFSLLFFVFLLAKVDRFFLKANRTFCRHFIDVKLQTNPQWMTDTPYPAEILQQPFLYLGKGAQSYVFESQDHNYVIKFYKFPSYQRQFGWVADFFRYRFSPKRVQIKQHNQDRFVLSYNSYFLAMTQLAQETGVVYAHLTPSKLDSTLTIVDRLGIQYHLPLDQLGFVIQRKGLPFLPLLKAAVAQQDLKCAQQMIDSLIELIKARCLKGITDLDNIDHDNYGWVDGHAIHLDVGRFKYDETVKNRTAYQKEILRITQILSDYLQECSPQLFDYYARSAITCSSVTCSND